MKNSNEFFGNRNRDLPDLTQSLNQLPHRVPHHVPHHLLILVMFSVRYCKRIHILLTNNISASCLISVPAKKSLLTRAQVQLFLSFSYFAF